jgi:hypothetical protein
MAAWVFSGVLVGFMALLLISLTVAAHCVNPARRHNSLRTMRLHLNWVGRNLCCGAWHLTIPDPVDDPWFQDPRRGPRLPNAGTAGISPALLSLLPVHTLPATGSGEGLGIGNGGKCAAGGEECAICQEEFAGGQKVAALPCRHAFHEPCIAMWLQRKATCPMCQQEVTEAAVKGQCPPDVAVTIPPPGEAAPHQPPGAIEMAASPPAAGLVRAQSV